MTRVIVKKNDTQIKKIQIVGHSGYQSEGSDIVCASISTMLVTTVNACLRVASDSIRYEKKEANVLLEAEKEEPMIQLLLENMVALLKELQEQYPNYIKLNEEVYL